MIRTETLLLGCVWATAGTPATSSAAGNNAVSFGMWGILIRKRDARC
jgi:hypothetical protein